MSGNDKTMNYPSVTYFNIEGLLRLSIILTDSYEHVSFYHLTSMRLLVDVYVP